MIGRTLNHYRIIEKLGEGAMGEIYKAEDVRLRHRFVAIKILTHRLLDDEGAKTRIRKEAEAVGRLNHPNIATLHEFDWFEDQPFICMEYIDGTTLQERISATRLSSPEIIQLGVEIAEGLKYVHDHGVLHRDIKPSNIMLTQDGHVKITDFGLAKIEIEPGITDTNVIMGTPRYMSPEAVQGHKVDHRSDLYSFGIVLFEMITGEPPFGGESWPLIAYKTVNEEIPDILTIRDDVPSGLASIVSELLAKVPEERTQDAGEVARAFRDMTSSPSS